VPPVALRRDWNNFQQGNTDVAISAIAKDLNASVRGDVRYTLLDPSPAAFMALDKIYPKGYRNESKPSPNLRELEVPILICHFG